MQMKLKLIIAAPMLISVAILAPTHADQSSLSQSLIVGCTPEIVEAKAKLRNLIEDNGSISRAWLLYDSSDDCDPGDFVIEVRDKQKKINVSLGRIRTLERAQSNVTLFLEEVHHQDTNYITLREVKMLCSHEACSITFDSSRKHSEGRN